MSAPYQVVDHGWDGDQYFQGCGTSGTPFDNVVTGHGDTPREAIDDALEQMAMTDDATAEAAEIALQPDLLRVNGGATRATACEHPKVCDNHEGHDNDDTCECPCHNPEWAYRVSIRWGTK